MTVFEDELRERFAELREYERSRTPALQLPRSGSSPRRGSRVARVGRAAGIAIAATVAVVVLLSRREAPAEMSITEWQAPTDVLLLMPGTEWLTEMPTLKYEGTP